MFDANDLFKQRLNEHIQTLSRYLRYILNGHTTIAILFLISVLAVYYQQWLSTLTSDFPTAYVIGIAFGAVITITPIQTFLKNPDLVFITVAENKMEPYFKRAKIYSFVIQLYVIFIVAAAFGPMYTNAYPERSGLGFLLILVMMLIAKYINMSISWWMLKLRQINIRRIDLLIRFCLNSGLFISIISKSYIILTVIILLFAIVAFYDFYISRQQSGLAWDVLVEKDANRMHLFYRMASMFVEVPHLKAKVKHRKALTKLIEKTMPFKQTKSYAYLDRLTFIRSNNYINMYIRLIILGSIVIYFVPSNLLKIILGVLFLYMSNFQMIALYHHNRMNMWLDLYPLSETNRRKEFITYMIKLTSIQTIIYSLIFIALLNYQGFLLMLILGLGFTFIFNHFYVKSKLLER